MRIVVVAVSAVVVGTAAACGVTEMSSPESPQARAVAGAKGGGGRPQVVPAAHRHFSAHLAGRWEIPAVDTRAQGQANLTLSTDGSELHFRVNVANIENTIMSHIHLGPPDDNGPPVVWLRPEGPPPQLVPGRINGPYAEGTITAGDLVGPLAGMPLSALIDAIRAGNTYINVHTSVNPNGEIRGQIR